MSLTDAERKAIHDLALNARDLLTKDARELLEGTYGLYVDGRMESADRLPQVQADPDVAETYRRLEQFLEDEAHAGLPKSEAIEKLIKEVAFTHLNRLVAFKMMESRKLIRGTIDKGTNSNAFKFYLADHADDMERFQRGDADTAYRHFLLWQAGQVAQEMAVLFDPETLPSRLFPHTPALNTLIEWLNQPEMSGCWAADETIGWVYQFFNEPELQAAFANVRLTGAKFEARDVPAATQLFTPNWIVRFLVQNTLGRTWVQMHPDTRLINTDLLNYLVPLKGDVPAELLRPVREITLLDPACGTMHFGLVAFDLFAAMYQEELDRAGEGGWLDIPSLTDSTEIASAIVEHNLYGIDIDLRAVQLSALALYLKAKSLNKNAKISDSHLACADVLPLNESQLGTFLREMKFSPLTERLIKTMLERLKDVNQFGSLLRLEREINALLANEARYPLIARQEAGFGPDKSITDEDFLDLLFAQIIQGMDEYVKQQAEQGADIRFFKGETVKGLRMLEVLLRRYDVVVTNPPYLSRRKMNRDLAEFMDSQYPEAKNDLYAAFISRALELTHENGMVGMLTMQSFMFISSYEATRAHIREQASVISMAHSGPGTFEFGNPGTLQPTMFTLRKISDFQQRENLNGTYIRLVNAPTGDGKREGLEYSLATSTNLYQVAQQRFNAIPGAPWAYWVSETIRELFIALPKLGEVAEPKVGLQTGENERFLRFWWEVQGKVVNAERHWVPYMKGGDYRRWYGNQEFVICWLDNGREIRSHPSSVIRNPNYYSQEGVTWGDLGTKGFNVRYLPPDFIFDVKGSSGFPAKNQLFTVLALMNSKWMTYVLGLLNPTVSFQVGDISRVPFKPSSMKLDEGITKATISAIHVRHWESLCKEQTFEFICPAFWHKGLDQFHLASIRINEIERFIDKEIFTLYGIDGKDHTSIEAELTKLGIVVEEGEIAEATIDDLVEEIAESPLTHQELAVHWISYAVGVVLGRFQPGVVGALGRAIYKPEDFAVGSLPAPDAGEFDLLVGTADRFAYVDDEGGRHVFSAEVESTLRDLAVPDGITVLDEGHPRDLPALVEQALLLMLGDEAFDEVIRVGADGDLRKFLTKDFFTSWHFKWYRKRPVYWPLQSAKRSYGFVLFHEHFSKYTLYSLLRDYLDYRINRLRNEISDLQSRRADLSGKELKSLEKDIDVIAREVDELNEFSKTIERIANDGYQPEPDWIDDGVILRLAPLWELIPIWKTEPKKHWEKLEAGDFDWSHIAMKYWPDRVRDKCRTNKSFAIAHGHEEWFGG